MHESLTLSILGIVDASEFLMVVLHQVCTYVCVNLIVINTRVW